MTVREGLLEPPFRQARPQDIEQILPLAKSTVAGFVEHLWTALAEDGETADAFGRRAQIAFIDAGNTIVADVSGKLAAMLISYPMASKPNPHVPGMDELLVPLMRLFAKAAGSWYLHGIATAPEHVGRGLGSRILDLAERLGTAAGKPTISLLVIDTNRTAIRFYEKRGYRIIASEPVIRNGWQTEARDWLLMEKPLGDAGRF